MIKVATSLSSNPGMAKTVVNLNTVWITLAGMYMYFESRDWRGGGVFHFTKSRTGYTRSSTSTGLALFKGTALKATNWLGVLLSLVGGALVTL